MTKAEELNKKALKVAYGSDSPSLRADRIFNEWLLDAEEVAGEGKFSMETRYAPLSKEERWHLEEMLENDGFGYEYGHLEDFETFVRIIWAGA